MRNGGWPSARRLAGGPRRRSPSPSSPHGSTRCTRMSLRSGEPGPGRDQGTSGTSQSGTWRAILVGGYSGAGVLLVGAASRSTQILAIRLSAQFGLLQLLPPAYWAGMGLIGVAMVLAIRQRSEILIVLTGMLFLAIVAGTPSLFEPNPRYFDTYLPF